MMFSRQTTEKVGFATLLYFLNGKRFKIIPLRPFLIHLITFLNEMCGFVSSKAMCK